jgi:hypothetical protein
MQFADSSTFFPINLMTWKAVPIRCSAVLAPSACHVITIHEHWIGSSVWLIDVSELSYTVLVVTCWLSLVAFACFKKTCIHVVIGSWTWPGSSAPLTDVSYWPRHNVFRIVVDHCMYLENMQHLLWIGLLLSRYYVINMLHQVLRD